MSVHLVLAKTSNGNEISIPIATESFFLKAWKPFAVQNSLHFIEEMQLGYDIDQTSLKGLIAELEVLKDNLHSIDYLAHDQLSFLEERVTFILAKIKNEILYPEVKGWVG